MATDTSSRWAVLGAVALALAGAFHTLAYLIPIDFTAGQAEDAARTAASMASASWFWSMFLPVVGLTFVVFGVVGLFAYLVTTTSRRWAWVALPLTVFGVGLYLPSRGVLAYALPASGRLYQEGQQDAIDIARAISTAAFGPVTLGAHFLYWIGFIALGVAIWRSVEGLSRWAGVLLALHGPLMHGPLFVVRIGGLPIVSILGSILLVLGGVLVAKAVLRRDVEGISTEQPSRVR